MEQLITKYNKLYNWLNDFTCNKQLESYNELEIIIEKENKDLILSFVVLNEQVDKELNLSTIAYSNLNNDEDEVISEVIQLIKNIITEDVALSLVNIYIYKVFDNKSLIFLDKVRNVDKED